MTIEDETEKSKLEELDEKNSKSVDENYDGRVDLGISYNKDWLKNYKKRKGCKNSKD